MSPRRALLALTAAATTAVTAPGAFAQQEEQEPSRPSPAQLFTQTLLDDERTTAEVKGLLQGKTGWVEAAPKFGDLTGDGRADAVVRVLTGGAAGAVAVYVLSTEGLAEDAALRVVYRNQQLHRAVTRLSGASLLLVVPEWARGDDTARASKYQERTYVWSAGAKTFRRTATRTVARPS